MAEANPMSIEASSIPAEANLMLTELLDELGLTNYYPAKITLKDVMRVHPVEDKMTLSMTELPWVILEKLVMNDLRGRDEQTEKCGKDDIAGVDMFFGLSKSLPNSLDLQVCIYLCCDPMLRQILTQKMFLCRLAFPLIIPHDTDSLKFYLWPFRTVIMNWRGKDGIAREACIVDHEMCMVSFIRVGRPSTSKSKVINDILSDTSHDTFYHKDCPQGMSKRLVANGIVEVTSYLPSGQDKDPFTNEMLFFNLRGEALQYPKQTELLCHVSSMIVLFVDIGDLADESITTSISVVAKQAKSLCLFLTTNNISAAADKRPHTLKLFEQLARKFSVPKKHLANFGKDRFLNTEEIKCALHDKIQKRLQAETVFKCSMKNIADKCEEMAVSIDENDTICSQGKSMADSVFSYLAAESPAECKTKMLPHQGELWQKWGDAQKTLFRAGNTNPENIVEQKNAIKEHMAELRKEQQKVCKHLNPMLETFIQCLSKSIDKDGLSSFFLKWLTIYLNTSSRECLPQLQHELGKIRAGAKIGISTEIKQKLDIVEEGIVGSSLGLEHLFREIGQLYEAFSGGENESNLHKETVSLLPSVMAKLILKGFPFEMMDGDTSTVPVTWVQAVLKSLNECLGGENKNMCIVGVIGIQSSGKSTLLNTMFGLEFAVSAGRCTRGIYAQLLEVDKTKCDLNSDYVLILDSEGLRAPEMVGEKIQHDNELATLIVGLSDFSLINLFGENTAEMQDVLQIIVHALLRMKLADSMKPRTCVFVHQNVLAVDAKVKLSQGNYKMQDTLDTLTKVAAAEEGKGKEISLFKHVINFDATRHVCNISSLWAGNPPMDPINPRYSGDAAHVRNVILKELKTLTDMSPRSLDQFPMFLKDIWTAILAEDFVFSFQNSLDARAYKLLDEKTFSLIHSMNDVFEVWANKEAYIKIESCSSEQELDETCNQLAITLEEMKKTLSEKKIKSLQHFIKENEDTSMKNWEEDKKILIQTRAAAIAIRMASEIDSLQMTTKVKLKHGDMTSVKIYLMEQAHNLADKLKLRGSPLTQSIQEEEFEEMWKSLSDGLQAEPPKRGAIKQEMRRVLHDYLRTKGQGHYLNDSHVSSSIATPWTVTDLDLKHTLTSQDMKNHLRKENWEKYSAPVICDVDDILGEVEMELSNICTAGGKFMPSHAVKVFTAIENAFESKHKYHEQSESHYYFTPSLKAYIACHAFRFATFQFEQRDALYEEKYGIESQIQELKKTAFGIFKELVNAISQEQAEEITMAKSFVDSICPQVKTMIEKDAKRKMKIFFLSNKFNTKFTLINEILKEFALQGVKYKDCCLYLGGPTQFVKEWIRKKVDEHYFGSAYATEANRHLSQILDHINTSIAEANLAISSITRTSDTDMMQKWVAILCTSVRKEVPVSENLFSIMRQRPFERKSASFKNFQQAAKTELNKVKDLLEDHFRQVSSHNVVFHETTSVYEDIFTELWGCTEHCPFCYEPCVKTDKHGSGSKHFCNQHRPCGLTGRYWTGNKTLVTENCSINVIGSEKFTCMCKPKCSVADINRSRRRL